MILIGTKGVFCILVSVSVAPIVQSIAHEVGAHGYIATQLAVVRGHLSGEISGPVIEGHHKLRSLQAWADAELGSWKLVAAFGDHLSDVPFMSVARQAIAVNPGAKLRKVAHRNGWQCINWESGGGYLE